MPRSRNIKPGFFKNEDLIDLPFETRLLFIGLWTMADREGRLEDRPKKIKIELFPCDNLDIDDMLNQLGQSGFILRYSIDGNKYISIINFQKHQNPHYKEVPSEIPPPHKQKNNEYIAVPLTEKERQAILERDGYRCLSCGATEDLTIDHIIPRSKGGSSEPVNLQTLCRSCNTSKSNRLDYNSSSVQSQTELNSSSVQVGTLIPDSLNLIPDTLNSTSSENEFSDASLEMKMTKFMIKKILESYPQAKIPKTESQLHKWCLAFNRLMRIDKRSVDDIRAVMQWIYQDDFWCVQIRSPDKLREKWDTVYLQMTKKGKQKPVNKPIEQWTKAEREAAGL